MAILENYLNKEVVIIGEMKGGKIIAQLSNYEFPFVKLKNLVKLITCFGEGDTLFKSEILANEAIYNQNIIKEIYLAKDFEEKEKLKEKFW